MMVGPSTQHRGWFGIQFEDCDAFHGCRDTTMWERTNLRVAIDTGGTFTDCVTSRAASSRF